MGAERRITISSSPMERARKTRACSLTAKDGPVSITVQPPILQSQSKQLKLTIDV